jgi:hypothetical protein
MKEQENKPKVIFETIVCYQGVKFNTVLKITAKELIFKKQKLFSDKYKTVLRVLINDIIVKNNEAEIELDRNDITIFTRDDKITFCTEDDREARKIVDIVYSLRTGRRYKEEKEENNSTLLKILKGTLAVGGAIAVAAGTYTIIKKKKKMK